MPSDKFNKGIKAGCFIVGVISGLTAIALIILTPLYEIGAFSYFCPTSLPVDTLAIQGDYVLLGNTGIIRKCFLHEYSIHFSVHANITPVEIFSVSCDSLALVANLVTDLLESSTLHPLLTQSHFKNCSEYERICILDRFLYQALTDESIIVYNITLDHFVPGETKIQIVAFDNLISFLKFVEGEEGIANALKHMEVTDKTVLFFLNSTEMQSSSYHFFAIKDSSNASKQFTVNREGTHLFYYNATTIPSECVLNERNNICKFKATDSNQCFLGHVQGNEADVNSIALNQVNNTINLQPRPIPTDEGRALLVIVFSVVVLLIATISFFCLFTIIYLKSTTRARAVDTEHLNISGTNRSKSVSPTAPPINPPMIATKYPVLFHTTQSSEHIPFDEKGLCYHCNNYGVTIIIPKGAVHGPATLQYKASLLPTQFKCEGIYQPVSPFIWIHFDRELKKPAELCIPHYMMVDNDEDKKQIFLLTRGHEENAVFSVNNEPGVEISKTMARVRATHFCSLCLAAVLEGNTPQLEYNVIYAQKVQSDGIYVDVCVLYSFRCFKVITEYYENKGFEVSTAKPLGRVMTEDGIEYSVNLNESTGWKFSQVQHKQHKITPDDVDFFKVLGRNIEEITTADITRLEEREKSGSYPPRLHLFFYPEHKHTTRQFVDIALSGSKDDHLHFTIMLKAKESFGCASLEPYSSSDSEFCKAIPFLESMLKNDTNLFKFICYLGLDQDQALRIFHAVGYSMKHCLQEAITKWEELSSNASFVDIARALAYTGVTKCDTMQHDGIESHQMCTILRSLPSSSKLTSEPEFSDLANHIAAELPDKWELFGIQLKVPHQTLAIIKGNRHRDTIQLCFQDVFYEWRRLQCSPFTWATVLAALCSPAINEYKVAEDLCDYLQEIAVKKVAQ